MNRTRRSALVLPLATLSLSLVAAPGTAHAIRVWEEAPPVDRDLPVPPLPVTVPTFVGQLPRTLVSPDITPPPVQEQPLAAGGLIGVSRFAPGEAPRWLDLGLMMQPRFSLQTGYSTAAMSEMFSGPPGFSLGRARIVGHAQLMPWFQARFEFEMSRGTLDLLDAYALFPVRRYFQVQVGQFRVPFSRAALVSGSRYQFTEQSLWLQGGAQLSSIALVPSFDLGAMVWGWVGPNDLFEYYAGVFNGEGRNRAAIDGYFNYVGRVVVNPLGRPRTFQEGAVGLPWSRPVVQIALNATYQQKFVNANSMSGQNDLTSASTLGADVYFAGWGVSLYGEVYYRATYETDLSRLGNTESFAGLLQVGWLPPAPYMRDHIEFVARGQIYDPTDCVTRPVNTSTMAGGTNCVIRYAASAAPDQYAQFEYAAAATFGANWYLQGHGVKVSANYTLNYELRGLASSPTNVDSAIVNNDQFTLQVAGSF